MKNNTPSYASYRKDYETAKALGAPAIACNAVMIPTGHESMRLLIQNFPLPIATRNDSADVDYGGGLASHTPGVAKTNFEGSITVIETETAATNNFAQWVTDNGGEISECTIIFGASDGTAKNAKAYKILDVAITFSDGGGDVDSSSRSQILTVSGSTRFMYFGENANLGATGQAAINSINSTLSNLISGTASNSSTVINSSLDGLTKLVKDGSFSAPNTTLESNSDFLMGSIF